MAERRRGYGSGSMHERRPGVWVLQVNVGKDPITGNRRRTTTTFTGSKREAQKELARLIAGGTDRAVDRSHVTFGELLDRYFDTRPGDASPTSIAEGRNAVARYVPEPLTKTRLRKLGSYELDVLYRHLETAGGVCRKRKEKCTTKPCEHGGGAPLAGGTVTRLHHDIHAALEQAVKWGWITTNPADLVTLSDVDERDVDVDPAEVLVLLEHLDKIPRDSAERAGRRRGADGRVLPRSPEDPSPLPDFVDALLGTGARPAELCAFLYGQLDLDKVVNDVPRPQVKIDASIARAGTTRKSTKTKKARRPVLDAHTAKVLADRRTRWLPAALAVGIPLEQLHVFPSPTDVLKPIRPDGIGRLFAQARDDAGVSDQITLRNLRHLVASLLAEAGVHPTTIAGRLGNSAVLVLQRYAHIVDTGNAAAADIVNKRLGRSS